MPLDSGLRSLLENWKRELFREIDAKIASALVARFGTVVKGGLVQASQIIGTLPTAVQQAISHANLANLTTGDPHTQYQKESEKAAANGYAGLDAGTKVPTAQLGGAGADATKFLRGDQSWQVPAGGSLTVKEEDNAPSVSGVTEIKVPNGSLTDNTGGSVSIALSATDSAAIHDNVAGEIAAIAEKASPADADMLLIEDSADGNAKKRTPVSAVKGAGGSVATDAIWDAAGDLAVGSGADTATKLAKGTDGRNLGVNAAGTLGYYGSAQLIEDQILGSDAANFTFSSIPGDFRHLLLIVEARGTQAAVAVYVTAQFNADGGNNYDFQQLYAAGTGVTAAESLAQASARVSEIVAANGPAGSAGSAVLWLPNYSRATFHKTGIATYTDPRNTSTGTVYVGQNGIRWRNTNAITQIVLACSAGNFLAGSTASLYGLSV